MADLRVQRQSMGKRLAALPCYDTSNARAQVQNQSHANSFITMPRGNIWYLELTFSQQLRVEKKKSYIHPHSKLCPTYAVVG